MHTRTHAHTTTQTPALKATAGRISTMHWGDRDVEAWHAKEQQRVSYRAELLAQVPSLSHTHNLSLSLCLSLSVSLSLSLTHTHTHTCYPHIRTRIHIRTLSLELSPVWTLRSGWYREESRSFKAQCKVHGTGGR